MDRETAQALLKQFDAIQKALNAIGAWAEEIDARVRKLEQATSSKAFEHQGD